MSVRVSLDVRYSECDMQRVVHNSNYLKWCDDAADLFFRASGAELEDDWWDVMVKAASITWSAPARLLDTVDIDVSIARFGRTSFDMAFHGTRGGEPLFEGTLTYVCVRTGTLETIPVPDDFRELAPNL